jgi:hypothetical protein
MLSCLCNFVCSTRLFIARCIFLQYQHGWMRNLPLLSFLSGMRQYSVDTPLPKQTLSLCYGHWAPDNLVSLAPFVKVKGKLLANVTQLLRFVYISYMFTVTWVEFSASSSKYHKTDRNIATRTTTTTTTTTTITTTTKGKAVPLHDMVALGGRGSIAPTHSWPRH